jgi:competence protein ComGC
MKMKFPSRHESALTLPDVLVVVVVVLIVGVLVLAGIAPHSEVDPIVWTKKRRN